MYELTEGKIGEYITPLAEMGWLNLVNYDEHDEASWQQLESDLRSFSHLEAANTALLCSAVMNVPGIKGHCFFVSERFGLVTYPHENIGFGIFADKETEGNEIAESFLRSAPNGCFEFAINER
ncbi:hypothetical protein BH24DEI2_BH24DEI2_20370 [soil metagenome]